MQAKPPDPHAADGGFALPQAHLRPQRRRPGGPMGRESVLAILLRRGILSARMADPSDEPDQVAESDPVEGAGGVSGGNDSCRSSTQGDNAARGPDGGGGYDGTGEGRRVSHRRQERLPVGTKLSEGAGRRPDERDPRRLRVQPSPPVVASFILASISILFCSKSRGPIRGSRGLTDKPTPAREDAIKEKKTFSGTAKICKVVLK